MIPTPLTRALLPLLIGVSLIASAQAADLNTDRARYSYALGLRIGEQVKSRNLEIDPAAFANAIEDVLAGRKPQMTAEQINKAFDIAQAEAVKKRKLIAETNAKAGEAFRAAYAKKEGAKTLDNGLLYRVIKAGSGPTPAANATVKVHYRGTHTNGVEFDSSIARNEPASFGLNNVIPGFSAALKKMTVGSKWEVVIPSDQGYGQRGAPPNIGPDETLVFEIELLGVK